MEQLEQVISTLESRLPNIIEDVWQTPRIELFIKALAKESEEVFHLIAGRGDESFAYLENPASKENRHLLPHYVANYAWAAMAKSFMVLWRDTLFEFKKGYILVNNGEFEAKALDELRTSAQQTIRRAADDLLPFIEAETARLKKGKGTMEKQINTWSLQHNPWPTYKAQLQEIPKQCQELLAQFEELNQTSDHFKEIIILIDQTFLTCQQELGQARQLAESNILFIEENFDQNLRRIAPHLKDQEEEIEPQNYAGDFGVELEEKLSLLSEKMMVPFQPIGGILQYKEINFQRSTRAWLESEILPLLYEIWELSANIKNNLKMSFVNIRNRILLLANEQGESPQKAIDKEGVGLPLEAFLQETSSWEEDLRQLENLIRERLDKDFKLTAIYNQQQGFLPIPLQSTLKQFRLNQNEVWQKARSWVTQKLSIIQRFKTALEQEESLSTSEKIVRLIESRKGDEANQQYNSIFLTKGYIGESFWVGRAQELQHMEKLIGQWKAGFRGSVLLSGRRFSGKSLFGELIANRFFPQNTIRLSPNSVIHVNGRRFATSFDLGEALDFIQKYTLNTPMLVWIDDLEVWGDANFWLNQNLRKLYQHIDSYSRRLFFLVGTSQWKKAQLDLVHNVSRVFQANIQLDRMSQDEIREAILIRHGATHKVLVQEDGQEVNAQQFKKMVNRTIKLARNNVGEALNLWALSTQKVDEDRVIRQAINNYILPDFITPENALLLRTLTIEKRMNEYRLRKQFGPAFKEKYSGILQRLISVGLLIRHIDGWLEINELVANDIGSLLEQKKYLLG